MPKRQKMTRKDQPITLVAKVHGKDENNKPTETEVERTVFASEKSVRSYEFYQSASFDQRPEIVYVVWVREYQGETTIRVGPPDNQTEYSLIRFFKPNPEEIELVCSGDGPRPRTR